jgi:hypothetical protein
MQQDKKMKRNIFLLYLLLVSCNLLQAQGFLNKVKSKFEEVSTALGDPSAPKKPSDKMYEAAKEDAAKTILEGKIKKDELGIGGVYYSKDLMMTGNPVGSCKLAVGKFLFTYLHESTQTKLQIDCSHTLDGNISPYTLTRDGFGFEIEHNKSKAMKQAHISGDANNSGCYWIAANWDMVEDGKVVRDKKVSIKPMGDIDFVQIESGLIFGTGSNGALTYAPKAGVDAEEERRRRCVPIFCFYTKEKESKAIALTQDQMYDLLVTFHKKESARMEAKLDGYKEMEDKMNQAAAKLSAANEGSSSGKSDSKNSSTTKNEKIEIEFQNVSSSDDIYLVFENNSKYGGTGRIGVKMITSYSFVPGAIVKVKGGAQILIVNQNDNGRRIKL